MIRFYDYLPSGNGYKVRLALHRLGIPFELEPGRTPAELGARLDEKLEGGHRALGVLEQGLRGREFLVCESYTLADLALYAYTHVAEEGGFELAGYPVLLDWFERVRTQPGHVPIGDKGR